MMVKCRDHISSAGVGPIRSSQEYVGLTGWGPTSRWFSTRCGMRRLVRVGDGDILLEASKLEVGLAS
jgi:hypothetical protein